MNRYKSKGPKTIEVSESGAKWITGILGGILLASIVLWIAFNAYTSVEGIRIVFGGGMLLLLGYGFPLSDIIALGTEFASRYFVDEDGKPLVSTEARNFVWLAWFLAAAIDVVLTFYVLDQKNLAQFASGEMHDAGIITVANRQIVPAVIAVVTYLLTIFIIHAGRGIVAASIGRMLGSGGSRGGRGGGSPGGRRPSRGKKPSGQSPDWMGERKQAKPQRPEPTYHPVTAKKPNDKPGYPGANEPFGPSQSLPAAGASLSNEPPPDNPFFPKRS